MSNERSKDQVDRNATKSSPELPDRSGRLTGHTAEPLKGVDPRTNRDAIPGDTKAADKSGLNRANEFDAAVPPHPSEPDKG